MANTILNLNGEGFLTKEEMDRLYNEYDAMEQGQGGTIIAGTITSRVQNRAGTRLAKGNKYDSKDPRDNVTTGIQNTTGAQLLSNVNDSVKTSLLANQELRKEQRKAATRTGVGGSILGGGAY